MAVSEKLRVELVSPERELWSGEGDMVIAKTLDGEIGIQPGHVPVLALLHSGGVVRILGAREVGEVTAAVHGGFMSVAENRVSILAEIAELSEEVDIQRAKVALDSALAEGADSVEARARAARARGRLRAAGEAA